MNQMDTNQLLETLSKMDKQELEKGIEKAQKILHTKEGETFFKNIQNQK